MKKLLGLTLLVAACAFAQMPGLFPWWDSPVVRNLNLSEDQRKQIRDAVREYRDQLIEQRADVQKAEANLQDLMNEEQVSESRTTEAIEKAVAARAALTRTYSMMSLKLRLVLTPQQWRELQRRRFDRKPPGDRRPGARRENRRPDRRPAPPAPPPPGPPAPGLDLE